MTADSKSIQYAFALDSHGFLIHISQVVRSQDYVCPGCRQNLSPVMGKKNARHFRHVQECCALETYLHRCAKEAFFALYQKSLNDGAPISLTLERQVFCTGERLEFARASSFRCQTSVPAKYNLTQFFDTAELEKKDVHTGLKPDVLLSQATNERRCYIEMCVTHPCSPEKIETGVPILEFKIASEADIRRLMTGYYSGKDDNLSVYNWQPPARSEETCRGECSVGNVLLDVWSFSESGRLNRTTQPLSAVDLTANTASNAWPSSTAGAELIANLRNFVGEVDPDSRFPNCVRCEHAGYWEDGFLLCRRKAKMVAYTEARQCASYRVKT